MPHGALAANGVDLPWLMYRDAQGMACAPEIAKPGPARWICLSHDFWAVRDYMRCGRMGWRDWLQPLHKVRYAVEFDPRDPGVFFWLLWQFLRQVLVGLKSRFRAL